MATKKKIVYDLKQIKKNIKCRENHLKKTIKNNSALYKQVQEIEKKINHNTNIVLSDSILTKKLKQEIKKEKDISQKKKLKQNLKRLQSLKKKIKQNTSNKSQQMITRKDKLIQTKWRDLLNTGNTC